MAEIVKPHQRSRVNVAFVLLATAFTFAVPVAVAQEIAARLNRARGLLESGRTDRAERETLRILGDSPRSPEAHRFLCDVRRVQSRRDDAIAQCRRATVLAPDRADYQLDLGDLLAQREDGIDEALNAYQRAAEIDPGNPRPHVSVASIYERRGRLAEAEAEYKEALQINPNIVQANAGVGAVLFNTGRLPEARAFLLRAIELRPRDLRSHIFLGLTLNHEGQYDLALLELRTAAGVDPFVANQISGLQSQRERFGRLREIFSAQLEAQPKDSRLHNNLGVVAYYLHEYETAFRHFTRAQQLGYPVDQNLKEVVYSRWRGLGDHTP